MQTLFHLANYIYCDSSSHTSDSTDSFPFCFPKKNASLFFLSLGKRISVYETSSLQVISMMYSEATYSNMMNLPDCLLRTIIFFLSSPCQMTTAGWANTAGWRLRCWICTTSATLATTPAAPTKTTWPSGSSWSTWCSSASTLTTTVEWRLASSRRWGWENDFLVQIVQCGKFSHPQVLLAQCSDKTPLGLRFYI